MKNLKDSTLQDYLDKLSAHTPVPGGGSAAALTAALGVALLSMVARYSLKKPASRSHQDKIRQILQKCEGIRRRLLTMVDRDARAYLKVVATRQAALPVKTKALREARDVPREVARLCYAAIQLTPYLVKKGNVHLLSDVEVAVELLLAGFTSAMINVSVNQ